MAISYRFRVRRGLSGEWTTQNPILLDGEIGLEKDTRKFKYGDGATVWNDLGYDGIWTQAQLRTALDLIGASASGDIIYKGVSGWDRLPKGVNGQVLTLASGLPVWADATGGGGPVIPAAAYWRIYVLETSTTDTFFCAIAGVTLRESAAGANLAVGGTASALTASSGLPASNAFDGNASTFWSTADAAKPSWLAYQMPAASSIRSVSIQAGDTAARAARAPKDFAIQYSTDGASWTTAYVFNGETGWALGETRVFNF